jgi:hypothetical protein
MLARLKALRAQEKFRPEGLYQAPKEESRLQTASYENALLDRLILGLPDKPTKHYVLSEFSNTLEVYDLKDTEDRERICGYLEQIMEILEIESSDGLLNTWLYGMDPNMEGLL